MNKKFITILLIIAVVIGCVGIFAACNGGNDLAFNGIDGYDVKIDHSAKTATVDVDCYTVSISLSKFKVSKNAELKVYINENLSDEIVDALTLDYGANVFFVNVSNGDKNLTYTLTVSRAKPSDTLDENKTVKSIEIIHWKDTYVVGEKFSAGILKVTYTDGSTQSLAMSLNMVSGFSTKAVGEFEVTITVKTINIKHKFTVVGASIPEYNRPGTADLDVDTFVDAICQYVAMVCTMHMTGQRNYQESYQLSFNMFKERHRDDFEFMAQCVSECGMGTTEFNELTESLTAALTDIGLIIKDTNDNLSNPIWGNEARLDRIRINTSKILKLLKPEQICMLATEKTDLILRRFNEDSMYDKYVELLDIAKKAGDSELSAALEKRVKEYDDLKLDYLEMTHLLLGEYNSLVYGVYNLFEMLDTILSSDSKALYKAVSCIMDIFESDSEALNKIIAGNGKYSYREIVENANFIGDLIIKTIDSNDNLTLMVSVLFGRLDSTNMWTFIEEYLNYEVYQVIGLIFKNITVADLTDIYLDYNEFTVAVNNNAEEAVVNAKLAMLVVRVTKLIDKAILQNGAERDVVAKGVAGWIVSLFSNVAIKENVEVLSDNMVAMLNLVHSINDPTKLSNEQVKNIIDFLMKFKNGGYSGKVLAYGSEDSIYYNEFVLNIAVGDDKASVLKLLLEEAVGNEIALYKYTLEDGEIISSEAVAQFEITERTIANLDWSTTGNKKDKIVVDGLEYELRYCVTAELKSTDKYALREAYDYWRFLGTFAIGDTITLERALSDGMYVEYHNSENTFERICVSAKDCSNLKLIGIDTSSVGEKYAYVIGDSEFGKQVFPVRYIVVDDNNPFVSKITLNPNTYDYAVGDKFDGYLEIEYNGDYNNKESKELDESKLTYDFSTPGYKKVVYTYENKQYVKYVNVYSVSMSNDISSARLDACGGIKGDDYIAFRDVYINFYANKQIYFQYASLDQIRAALKEVSADYDISLTLMSTIDKQNGIEMLHYQVKITRGEETVYKTYIMKGVIDIENCELLSLNVRLYVDMYDNEIKYAVLNISPSCGAWIWDIQVEYKDLPKFGQLTKDEFDEYSFESPYCDDCSVTTQYIYY